MANATLTIHAAGWLEGGLTFGYEKFITDIEALQTVAELCKKTEATDSEIGFDAIKDVDPLVKMQTKQPKNCSRELITMVQFI